MKKKYRTRRTIGGALVTAILALFVFLNPESYQDDISYSSSNSSQSDELSLGQNNDSVNSSSNQNSTNDNNPLATEILAKLEIKGRAPKTGYSRDEFYKNWPSINGCSLRQLIIFRELGNSASLDDDQCTVTSGEFYEPYTGKYLTFSARSELSSGIQIDHVVALSDAWQKGAQYLSAEVRYEIATDPLNLLAVDASANQQKSDSDAASWLPSNKGFRCEYVARQISVKFKYNLWITQAEHDAILRVLEACPDQKTVGIAE